MEDNNNLEELLVETALTYTDEEIKKLMPFLEAILEDMPASYDSSDPSPSRF